MAISAARVTRLGKSGYMTRPYGSFAGKAATEDASGTRRQRQIKSLVRARRRRR